MLLTLYSTTLFFSCLTSAVSISHAHGANMRHPRAFTAGSTSPQPDYACTNDIDWFGDRYNTEDCMAAVQRLWNTAVSQYDAAEFEFLAPGATNKTTLPTIQTPQRYSSGQCTLAIVMLNSFDPGSLPGERSGGTYKYCNTDVTSFESLWNSAGMIEMNCVLSQKQLGWAPGGDKYAIGIFMWNTDSYWNRQIPYSPPNNDTSVQNNVTASPVLGTTTSDGQEQLADTEVSTS